MMLLTLSGRFPPAMLGGLVWLGLAGAGLPASAQAAPLSTSAPSPPPSSFAPAPPAADPVPVMASAYVLVPGDQLDISVAGFSEYNTAVTVLPDGTFNYVGQGSVQAAGHTVEEVKRILTARLRGQVRHPQVTLAVRESHPRQISVVGAVRAPGVYNWRPGLTLLEAIAGSGDPAQAPELTEATLIHGTQPVPIDLVKLMEEHDVSQNVTLAPGDIILMSLRDPAAAYVQVDGQVTHAGPYPVPPGGATVQSVLAQAGGYTSSAALTQVQVTHDGQTKTISLRPLLFRADDPIGKTRVVAGDRVTVPLNNGKIAIYGEVRNPAIYPVPDGEALPVTTALATAGGPLNDGDRKNVSIVRYTPDGKQTILTENLDDVLKGTNSAADIPLQPGDILVVPKRRAGLNGFNVFQASLGSFFGMNALSNVLKGH